MIVGSRSVLTCSALLIVASAEAYAQPGPPTPASYVDLGPVTIGDTVDSGEVDLAAGGFVWFRFELTEGITPRTGWMDLDTYGPSVIQNCELAIYDNRKNLIASDNDSGGSGGRNNFAAAMSIGSGSGERLTLDPLGGTLSDGNDLQVLDAGVYWACIAGWDTSWDDPNNNWATTTTSTEPGKVRLLVKTGSVPAGYWNERHEGTDAGILPSGAMIVEGSGPLHTIMAAFSDGPRSVDTFKIRICDPAVFRVEAEASTLDADEGGGGAWGTRLYLFDVDERPVIAVDMSTNNGNAVLQPLSPTQLGAGDYYLAITTNCGGANTMSSVPHGAGGIMYDWGTVGSNITITPNGPGANQPVEYWGRIGNCNNAEAFVAKLALAGACFIDTSCPADIDASGAINVDDIQAFVDSFLAGCP